MDAYAVGEVQAEVSEVPSAMSPVGDKAEGWPKRATGARYGDGRRAWATSCLRAGCSGRLQGAVTSLQVYV